MSTFASNEQYASVSSGGTSKLTQLLIRLSIVKNQEQANQVMLGIAFVLITVMAFVILSVIKNINTVEQPLLSTPSNAPIINSSLNNNAQIQQ